MCRKTNTPVVKKSLMLVALAFVTVSLSACAGQNQNTNTSTNTKTEARVNNEGQRMPDFGQPEKMADIRGLVTSIVGNEVTILQIDRPQMGTEENTDGEKEGERVPGMGSGGGGGMSSSRSGSSPDSTMLAIRLEKLKEMSTGEKKVIIPVGIQMLKSDTANTSGEPNMLEASLSDISIDKMINVWINEDVTEKSVASFVVVTR